MPKHKNNHGRGITKATLKRRRVERKPNKRVLIVCEGSKTEKLYFTALASSLRLSSVEVEVCENCGSAPISVVNFAEDKATDAGAPEAGGYDCVFCVFDRDEHESFDRAKNKIKQLKRKGKFPAGDIVGITSEPCVEYWFLLHAKYTRAPYTKAGGKTAAEQLISHLKKVPAFKDYRKSLSDQHKSFLLDKTSAAVNHARRAWSDAERTNVENPSTLVHKIVEFLETLQQQAQTEARKSI